MASLVEELVTVLEEEEKIYQLFYEYGVEKTDVLIRADIPNLERLTALEQEASDRLLSLTNKQMSILKDISTVLGKTDEQLTVTRIAELMATQPEVRDKIITARDRLMDTAAKVQTLNQQNEVLIQQAIELAEFDITLFKSMPQAPETANYDKNAYNTGTLLGSSGFDAKQ